jgi:hypothetical protein
MGWLALPTAAMRERIAIENREKRQLAIAPPRRRREQPARAYRISEARTGSGYGLQSA